jgi:selenocysteine-specific elongation factor
MLICDRVIPPTTMIDAGLELFPQRRDLGIWTRAVFHLGSYERQARIHLIDRDRLSGGTGALVQIVLEEPCVAQYGDRFVVRNSSSDLTLGGGRVIDPAPLHHRRRPPKLVANMTRLAEGGASELIAAEIRKRYRPVGHREIADILNLREEDVRGALAGELPEGVVRYSQGEEVYLLARDEDCRIRDAVLTALGSYHKRHPLREGGLSVGELAGAVGLEGDAAGEAALGLILGRFQEEGRVKPVERTWALARHGAEIGPELAADVAFVGDFLRDCRMQTPLLSELKRDARGRGMDADEADEALRYLVRKGEAFHIDGNYIHAVVVDRCRTMLLRELARRGSGMTVAEFRDLVSGNRRICLLLLAIFDEEGVTRREGDVRVLTEEGRAAL